MAKPRRSWSRAATHPVDAGALMETGLGIDSRFALSDDEQRTIAREAAGLGYKSLWTPVAETRERFDVCVTWYKSSGLPTGVAVAPVFGLAHRPVGGCNQGNIRADGREVHPRHRD